MSELTDGRALEPLTFYDILQARAAIAGNTAAGIDNIPPEAYETLPFLVCIFNLLEFNKRQVPKASFFRSMAGGVPSGATEGSSMGPGFAL